MDKKSERFYEVDEAKISELNKQVKHYYNKIENYFVDKEFALSNYAHLSVEEMLANAPKYYQMINLMEKLYSFISKDELWLKHFIEPRNINFNWDNYLLWKSGKDYYKRRYDDTQCPSKWLTEIFSQLLEILKMLQILFYLEFYTPEEDFKLFLKSNPVIDFKIRANYLLKSPPSEHIDKILELIDMLLKTSVETAVNTTYIIDTTVCMNVYRQIDKSEIFTLLRRKEFYVKYRLEYLRLTPQSQRLIVPQEDDIIKVCEEFLMSYKGLVFTYNEYKNRLIEKYNKIRKKLKF